MKEYFLDVDTLVDMHNEFYYGEYPKYQVESGLAGGFILYNKDTDEVFIKGISADAIKNPYSVYGVSLIATLDKASTDITEIVATIQDKIFSGVSSNYILHFRYISGHSRYDCYDRCWFVTRNQLLNIVSYLYDNNKGYMTWTDYCKSVTADVPENDIIKFLEASNCIRCKERVEHLLAVVARPIEKIDKVLKDNKIITDNNLGIKSPRITTLFNNNDHTK